MADLSALSARIDLLEPSHQSRIKSSLLIFRQACPPPTDPAKCRVFYSARHPQCPPSMRIEATQRSSAPDSPRSPSTSTFKVNPIPRLDGHEMPYFAWPPPTLFRSVTRRSFSPCGLGAPFLPGLETGRRWVVTKACGEKVLRCHWQIDVFSAIYRGSSQGRD